MQKPWESAQREADQAKAEGLEFAIDALEGVLPLVRNHTDIQQVRATMHVLSVEASSYQQAAEKDSRLMAVGD